MSWTPARAVALALTAALGSLGPLAAHAALPAYTVEKLGFEGDVVPGLGTLNQLIGEVDVDDSGRVTFVGYVDDGVTLPVNKIWSVESGLLTALVGEGDVAPGTGGALFGDVGRSRIAAPGFLAYLGLYDDGGDTQWGAFLRDGVVDSAAVLPGTAAPGGGSISQVLYIHTASGAPSFSFGARVDTGGASPISAHFVHEPAGLREIYREGQPAPSVVGGTFAGVQPYWVPSLTPDGTSTFYAAVSGGNSSGGLFQASPSGVITPLVVAGDAVTTPGGGTFDSFFEMAGSNDDGDIVVSAFVDRAPASFARQTIIVIEGGTQREVVMRGDPILGTNPPRFYLQLGGSGPPTLDAAGTMAFTGILTDELENAVEVALLVEREGELGVLLSEGDPVPGVPGETFTDFPKVSIGEDGTIAFYAFTTSGTGVFRATPTAAVPALPPTGLGLLGLGLAVIAVATAQPRSQS